MIKERRFLIHSKPNGEMPQPKRPLKTQEWILTSQRSGRRRSHVALQRLKCGALYDRVGIQCDLLRKLFCVPHVVRHVNLDQFRLLEKHIIQRGRYDRYHDKPADKTDYSDPVLFLLDNDGHGGRVMDFDNTL